MTADRSKWGFFEAVYTAYTIFRLTMAAWSYFWPPPSPIADSKSPADACPSNRYSVPRIIYEVVVLRSVNFMTGTCPSGSMAIWPQPYAQLHRTGNLYVTLH
ncbi:hypothetical protein M3J09_011992 [Ascochyta lentis]